MIKQQDRKYGSTLEQLIEKTKKLDDIISIINSDLLEFDKAYQLYKLYNNSNKFKSTYSMIYKYGKIDPMFKGKINYFEYIYQIYLDYENKGYFEAAKAISKIEIYLVNYDNALRIISTFMDLDFDYDFGEFLNDMEIDEKDFNFCIKTIRCLNPKLLEDYELKLKENKLNRYLNNIEICRNVANGIKTGYLFDGTKFELLDFWRLMPFKNKTGVMADFFECREFIPNIVYSPRWINRIYNFTKEVLPDDAKIIYDYARNNKISDCTCLTELELKYLFGSIKNVKKTIVDGNGQKYEIVVDLNTTDFNNMVRYMRDNKIPLMLETFTLVFEKYINGEIVVNDNKGLIKK